MSSVGTRSIGAGERGSGWLRGPSFDLTFVLGVLSLALAAGGIALLGPSFFMAVLLADFWLLAYPHVASTFTRIALDRGSIRDNRFLLFGLPPMVLAATGAAAWVGGAVALNTIYFYWQSYHYTRQSYGIARAYRRSSQHSSQHSPQHSSQHSSQQDATGRDWLTDAVVLGFPLWGLLQRAAEQQPAFYGAPFLAPAVPWLVVHLAGAAALVSLTLWGVRQARALASGHREQLGTTLFVGSHVAITAVSYLIARDITKGWLFVNVWHNAQYIIFVWAANARRFQGGVDPERRFLSWMCQPERAVVYGAVCLGLGAAFYFALGRFASLLPSDVLPVVLTLHLAVNFHHYLVDSVIWRAPRLARAR